MAPGCCEPSVAPTSGGCCGPKAPPASSGCCKGKPSAKEQFLALCKSLDPEENKKFMVWLAKEVGERLIMGVLGGLESKEHRYAGHCAGIGGQGVEVVWDS